MGLMEIYYRNPEEHPIITQFLASKDEELGPVGPYKGPISKEPPPISPEYFNFEKLGYKED